MKKMTFIILSALMAFSCSKEDDSSRSTQGIVLQYAESEEQPQESPCFLLDEGVGQAGVTVHQYKDIREYELSDIPWSRPAIWSFTALTETDENGEFSFTEDENETYKYEIHDRERESKPIQCPDFDDLALMMLTPLNMTGQLQFSNLQLGDKVTVDLAKHSLSLYEWLSRVEMEESVDDLEGITTLDFIADVPEKTHIHITVRVNDEVVKQVQHYSGSEGEPNPLIATIEL